MIRHLRTLLSAHLRDEFRAGEVALVAIPFGAVALLIIPMAVGVDTPLLTRIGPGLFWAVVLLFGTVVTQRRSAGASQAHRDAITLLGVDPAARFGASAIATAVLLTAFQAALLLVTLVLYDPDTARWWWLIAIVPLVSIGLAMIGTLASNAIRGLDSRSSLAALLVVPISIPILLAASQATEGLRLQASILRWVLLLAVVDVVLALVGVLTARPMEES